MQSVTELKELRGQNFRSSIVNLVDGLVTALGGLTTVGSDVVKALGLSAVFDLLLLLPAVVKDTGEEARYGEPNEEEISREDITQDLRSFEAGQVGRASACVPIIIKALSRSPSAVEEKDDHDEHAEDLAAGKDRVYVESYLADLDVVWLEEYGQWGYA